MKYLFACGSSPTHIIRPAIIAQKLASQAAEIIFSAPDTLQAQDLLAGFGFSFYAHTPSIFDSTQFFTDLSLAEAERQVEEILTLLASVRPDVVVFDSAISTAVAARIANIPLVSLVEYHMTRQFFASFDVAVPPESAIAHLPERIARPIFNRNLWLQFWQCGSTTEAYNTVLQRHNLPPVESLLDLLVGDLCLVVASRELVPALQLPPSYIFVGPILQFAPTPLPDRLAGGEIVKPLLFVWPEEAHVQWTAVAAFANQPCTVVIAAPAQLAPPDQLQARAAPNIIISEQPAYEHILARADVVVGYGSDSTTNYTLLHGVPMVLVPSVGTHRWVAECLADAGVALCLPRNLQAADLRSAVNKILANPAYARKAQQFKETINLERNLAFAARTIRQFAQIRSQDEFMVM